jgi:hypothetical protein
VDVTSIANGRKVYKILVGKPKRRERGKPRYRWKVNMKVDLTEIGCKDVHWFHLPYDRVQWLDVVNTVMNLRVT